ncbi:hypothetical protein YC2023_010307 [Brassica napus]
MLIDMCVLVWLLSCTPGMHPDMWEEWWRPACVLDMQPDMWSTRCRRACIRSHAKRHTGCHQPEADWLRCCPELVQFYGFISVEVLLDTPLGSPKNCPEAKGGSVQISLSRPISFFMVKPRFCPSRDQSSQDVHLGFWPSPLRSTSYFSPRTLDNCVECVLCRQQVRNPPMLGMFWGGLVFPRPRIQRVLTLSPKVVDIKAMRFPLLEVRLWQEANSNLVTVALGKDDWIAWCWTLGPPV